MKFCPQCETENPSKANNCMNCGSMLTPTEKMDELDKLHRELSETKKTNELLKAALEQQLTIRREPVENNPSSASVASSAFEERQAVDMSFVSKSQTMSDSTGSSDISIEEDDDDDDDDDDTSMFSSLFSFEGRIRRLEYRLSVLISFIYAIIVINTTGFICFLLLLPGCWFLLSQGAKRCHDLNKSGWYQIIPFYGFWMLSEEGDYEENSYGDPPK